MRRLIVLATVCSLLVSGGPVQAGSAVPVDPRVADRYVVLFREGSDVDSLLAGYSRLGVRPALAFRHAVRGFAARLDGHQLEALKADPTVALIEADRVVRLESQRLPTGVERVRGDQSPTAGIDGLDERVDADIAIIDTGIQAGHPDLNVAGGYNCTTANTAAWGDGNGHGTHVAGIAAAKDNGIGVVGVAPGARLWAVRVFDSTGFSRLSWIVCGIDWVTSQRDPVNPAMPLFEAANMSLRDAGSNDRNCGLTKGDAEHQAICRSVAAGVTYAVAAGNDSTDAARWIPAAYPEVITVSALADFNGQPGGGAPSTCHSFGSYDSDDTFANFSNYGAAVDLIAPGKCIYSTYPTTLGDRSGYVGLSGTSMAAPHVAGAIALYKVSHPSATPSEVQAALQAAGTYQWATATDPDPTHERLLNVSSFGAPPGFSFSRSPTAVTVPGAGGTATYTATIIRANGFSDPISFSVTGLPLGATGTFTPNPASGLSGLTSTLTVTVPGSIAAGTYGLTITGSSGAISGTASIAMVKQAPLTVPAAPTGVTVLASGSSARLSWAAPASDGGSPVTGYTATESPAGSTCTTDGALTCTISGLADGLHAVTVSAANASGTGPSSDPPTALRIDTTPPTATAPVASLATNATLGTSTVPVSIAWSGADAGSGIDHYELAVSTSGKAYVLVAGPTATRASRSFRSSSTTTYRFRVRAFDRSGNPSGWAYGSTFQVRLVQESSTALRYAGTWWRGTSASASAGHYRYATRRGTSVGYTFIGRAVAVVAYRRAALGKVRVYLDGHYRATVSLGATSTAWRRIVFAKRWTSSGRHTIRLVWAGTASHRRIDLDAFVVLR